jgi:predicted transcriptional regulator of viral defense system
MKHDPEFPSLTQLAYNAIRNKSLTVNEIVEASGIDPDHCRVQIGRWLRKDVIRRGAIRDGRQTYTARGASEVPKFIPNRGKVPEMILSRCQRKWHTARELIKSMGVSDSTVRKALAALVKKRKLEVDHREGGVYAYRAK